MADEQDKWLDRETAERLLRGESLEAVDPSARDQAERLSRALGALSAEAAPATGELPGEQAALAAFRKAREAAEAERTAAAHAPSAARAPAPGTDADLIRIAAPARTGIPVRRPRRVRPARLALAAALAAGTLGGVAVAAGSGALPAPFGDAGPRPTATAGTTTGRSLASPSPRAVPDDGNGTGAPATKGTPGGRAEGSHGAGPGGTRGQEPGTGRGTAPGTPSATPGTGWLRDADACRALRDGEDLDAGRRRALEHLAGGAARVSRYCEVLLSAGGHGEDGNSGKTKRGKEGKEEKEGKGDQGRGQGSGGRPVRPGSGHGGGRHGGVAPAPSVVAPHTGGPDRAQPGHGQPGHGQSDRERPDLAPSPAHSARSTRSTR
ncbi:hypothetical protein [Streptomyces eurythermus]|uniref:hypothetical protein n=1 Tax=Streptomyces eurythermus TaxID=42237 RepID=UPI0016792A0F|nr:hypothetical protein [Streptomyces eurythermus]GGR53952.1 hypothetical protein GCM10010236_02290 [Streptomyces eurythermus]